MKIITMLTFLALSISHSALADGVITVYGKLVLRPTSAGVQIPAVVEDVSNKVYFISEASFEANGSQTCEGSGKFELTSGMNGEGPYRLISTDCEE